MISPKGPLAELVPSDTSASDPIELLGWMLQLRGTVHMAALLDERPVPPRPTDAERAPAQEAPLWRIDHLRALALRPLRSPLSGRHALADATRVLHRLSAGGLLGRRRRADVDDAADELSGAFHKEVAARVTMARSGIAGLRAELSSWLQSLGPAAAYLEKLDADLRLHTEERARQLFDRLGPALQQRFRDALWTAVPALPDEPTVDDVDAWYRPGGWVHAHIATCRGAVAAVCRHEARALEALVAAAQELAITPDQPSEHDE